MISALLSLLLLSVPAGPLWKGVAVTPYSEDPARGLTYLGMIDEIADLGATHVSLVVQWSQASVASNHIGPHPKETQDEAVVRAMARRARARGVKVMLFPILWLEERGPGLWRGALRPENPSLWWASYRAYILHMAELARDEGAAVFSVGSELSSMEGEAGRWRALIAEVRTRFHGALIYSANWDHYDRVPFWADVDLIGVSAYFRLTLAEPPALPSESELVREWSGIRQVLGDWHQSHHPDRPLVFTEVGYPSQRGAARRPWEYTAGAGVELEEQRRCYAAFASIWSRDALLAGVFFWNWWGVGGVEDGNYTPRGKPALDALRALFHARP